MHFHTGISNLIQIVNGKFFPDQVPKIEKCPLLILRPRAWNMNEHNFMVIVLWITTCDIYRL